MKRFRFSRLCLCLVMIMALSLPVILFAQQGSGFFGGGKKDEKSKKSEENGFFGKGSSIIYLENPGNNFSNQPFGVGHDYVPLGSGVCMLIAAGVGYALAKSKKKKKGVYMVVAMAMLLGLTQCKKDKENPETPAVVGDEYPISLVLGGGSDTRSEVYPFDGPDIAPVYYKENDIIYVFYNQKFAGTITCQADAVPADAGSNPNAYTTPSATFSGNITVDPDPAASDKKLYFFFVGNSVPVNSGTLTPATLTAGSTTSLTVNISDQTDKLPVISYAASKEDFTGAGTYTLAHGDSEFPVHEGQCAQWLLNQCALVKFKFENIYDMSANTNDNNSYAIYQTTKPITIYGMDNQVTISFDAGTGAPNFAWTQVSDGAIKLHSIGLSGTVGSDTARYAIIHHGNYSSVTAGNLSVPFKSQTDPYGFYGTYKIEENVKQNDYFDGAKLDLVWHSGAFSIGASDTVVFSRGNLQYAARGAADPNGTWRFAKHQYDFVGGLCEGTDDQYLGNVVYDENTNSAQMSDNTQILNISSYDGWIDLFGWGTGNVPTVYRSENDFYTASLTAGTSVLPHNNYDGFHDWGANNIVNSGKPGNTSWWTTLSKDESKYLVDSRTDANSKVGFGQIIVSSTLTINGLILLPDHWTISSYPTSSGLWIAAGDTQHDFNNNVFNSVSDWMLMEAAGAVFLPAAGYRDTDGWPLNPKIEYDAGSGTHGENQDRGTYYLSDIQGLSAAWSLSFGESSGDDLLISGLFQDDTGTGNDHVNPKMGAAPDNGRSVRLVHKLSSGSSKFGLTKRD